MEPVVAKHRVQLLDCKRCWHKFTNLTLRDKKKKSEARRLVVEEHQQGHPEEEEPIYEPTT
jgi:hypothetical protein